MCAILISKALRLARVNETQCYLPPTRLSTYGMSHPSFTSQPQSIAALWPVLISRPAEDRRLSWPGWLGEILRWFDRPKTITRPCSSGRGGRESNPRPSSRESNAVTTGHRASTSTYSLTFCFRVMLPERHQWKPAVQAAAVMLRTPPSVDGQSTASSAHRPRRAFALCRHIAGWTQTCNQGSRYVAVATQPVHRLQIRPIVHN